MLKLFPKKILYILGITILLGLVAIFIFFKIKNNSIKEDLADEVLEPIIYPKTEKEITPPPSMEILKKKGCVADGLLFGYTGKDNTALEMINRSECQYIHRAVETWLDAPDFEKVAQRKAKITKENMVYSMFIAEAIDKKVNYYYPAEERDFNFSKMCRKGSSNFWGEHTCKPSFERSEYRKYLRYITSQAIDNGIQVFLFGQIFYQESSDLDSPVVAEIIEEMKSYAAFKGVSILIGAQTNDIINEKYLRLFDFIEGGVGLSEDGKIENGPCFSRWWNKETGGWCWALLWNEKYSQKANDVLLHLDWSGKWGDDMSTFARMSQDDRSKTLKYLYEYFTSRNFGFLMPMLATLHKENGGCSGDKSKYYSADDKFSCNDEDTINAILQKTKIKN